LEPLRRDRYYISCTYKCNSNTHKCANADVAAKKHPDVAAFFEGKMLDKLGQEIHIGSIIAYGHALGRCAGIRIGKVMNLEIKYDKYDGRPGIRITVQGVDDDWDHREPELTGKKGTLMFPSRIIVLDPTKVPSPIMDLLNKV